MLFNPQSLNRFSYVLNNPVNFVDPSGYILTFPQAGCDVDYLGSCSSYLSATTSSSYTPAPSGGGGDGNTPTPTVTPQETKPVIRVICGYGVSIACSTRDVSVMDPATQQLYNGYYPFQPLVEYLEGMGYTVKTYDVIYDPDNPQKATVAGAIETEILNSPNEQDILVTHSAGSVTGNLIINQLPNQVIGLVALDPDTTYQTVANGPILSVSFAGIDPSKLLIGSSSTGTNTGAYHYYGGILDPTKSHTDLTVNSTVIADIINFVTGKTP